MPLRLELHAVIGSLDVAAVHDECLIDGDAERRLSLRRVLGELAGVEVFPTTVNEIDFRVARGGDLCAIAKGDFIDRRRFQSAVVDRDETRNASRAAGSQQRRRALRRVDRSIDDAAALTCKPCKRLRDRVGQ